MTRPYISLHNHTIYSIGDSLIQPKQLFAKTEELGQKAVAVTDHGSCAGLWESFQVSKKSNVKLIAGCECFFVNDASNNDDTSLRHIILLAKNAIGYKNLLTINKRGFDQMTIAFKKAISRVDWKLLEQFSDGLICTSACGNGVIGQYIMADRYDDAKAAAKRFKDIFGDNFALELQAHHLQIRQSPYSGPVNQQKINLALKKISLELGIRCIVTTDAHYVQQEHHRAHDVYLCNSSGQPISSGNRLKYDKHEFYIKDADSLYSHFERHIQMWGEGFVNSLFENTEYYADQCEKPEWIDPTVATGLKNQLPTFPVKDEPDYDKFIEWQKESKFYNANLAEDANFYRYRTEIGLEQKISAGKIKEEDRDKCYEQMKEEFDVLEYRNFSSYMLIVAGFLKWCRDNGVPTGVGRGSVGGSLTAYFNSIHQANPFTYNLIFARFLNKYKEAYPDVDSDVSGSDRDKVLKYMREKYGIANVAHVSNINTITPKVYARDISRIFEFGGEGRTKSAEIGDAIADSIPAEIHSVKQALTDAPLFAEYAKQYPELAEFAELLNGLPRAWSTHAGGIVVSQNPLEQIVPVRNDSDGSSCIALAKNDIEEASCIKLDLLGLETLDIIRETERLARQNGKQIPTEFNYELENEKVYEMIANGDTYGVFQLDGTAVHVCKKIKPKNISDIAIITALIRPSSKDIIDDFVKARNGETKVELLHPKLERALGKTYGFGLFEESLLYLALDIAGWDLYNADKLRKLTKEKGKNPEKIQQWKKEFIEGATKNGIDVGERVWGEVIESFNGYGFNKCLGSNVLVDVFDKNGKFISSKKIKDIIPGEYVKSRDENAKKEIFIEVLNNYHNGIKEIVEVELVTGEKVRCTQDHKFRVKETGEMLPLWKINELKYSIEVNENIK
jgi:DNA polymerase-3 subunit alpha